MNRVVFVAGFFLLLSFGIVLWEQFRQIDVIQKYLPVGVDNPTWVFSQMQIESLKLERQLMQVILDKGAGREELELRYDIFVSRIAVLDQGAAARLVFESQGKRDVLGRLKAFVAWADPSFDGTLASHPWNDAWAHEVLSRLQGFGEDLSDLHLASNTQSTDFQQSRNKTLSQVAVESMLVALVEFLLVVAFAFLLFRQLGAAKAATAAKGRFLANMSHEIRTPLNGVLGLLEIAIDEPDPTKKVSSIRTAQASARHLLVLLNDILDLSKAESGKLDLEQGHFDVHQLIAEPGDILAFLFQEKGLPLDIVLQPDFPQGQIGDSTRLRQILLNLLNNACKFTEAGRVILTCLADKSTLTFRVEDTGIGMGDETVKKLFQRFTQADSSVTRKYGGTGLGLEISRNLAGLMGGTLGVESELGRGSTFTLTIPRRDGSLPPRGPSREAPAVDILPAMVKEPRILDILAVDDVDLNLLVLKAQLKKMGHRVTTANGGPACLALLAQRGRPFDLVLMDLHMPELSGIETAEKIRALGPPWTQMPMVALTADVMAESKTACKEAGMEEFLAKPVPQAALEEILARLFG